MPTARGALAVAELNGILYAVGGYDGNANTAAVEAYDPLSGGPKPGGSFSRANEMFLPPSTPTPQQSRERASPKQVGTIMALLATFQDAQALPPQSSPDANRLIKALIQFQAAFMKSDHPAIRQLLIEALNAKFGTQADAEAARFRAAGWTSESLEALIEFIAGHNSWQQPDIRSGFHAYNVGEEDFLLLAGTFETAHRNLAEQGRDLHSAYAERRREMPGAGS